MKVLQVLPHLNIGGITTYAYTLSKYLIRNDIQIAICSSGGSQESKFKKLGVKTYYIPIKTKNEISFKVIASALKMAQIQKIFPYKLLHSHNRATQVASQLTSLLTGLPHVANFHGFYKKNKKRKIRKIIRAQGKKSIAITPFVKNDLVNYFRADPKKITTILSGIDLEILDKNAPPLQLKGNPVIGSSGRLSPVKGFQHLIQAIPKVIKKYPEAKFYVLGEGNYEKDLLHLAQKLKIKNYFTILRKKPISAFLNSLDIFCLPSLEEPLGLSVVEAQYLEVPSLVSGVDGLNLLVEDRITGLKVNPASPQSISLAIIELAQNKKLSRQIAQNAKNQVMKKFNIAQKIKSFIQVYEKAIKNNSGST